jgi:pilus assembly protein CpaB
VRMTRRAAYTIAFISAVLAALALYVYWVRSTRARQPEAPKAETVAVVVASEDITAESVLEADKLGTVELPADEVPRNAASDPGQVVNKVALVVLPAGQVIRTDQVVQPGPSHGLAWTVPSGMRAVTVAIDPISGVAGFLKPGNRVDVLATMEQGDTTVVVTVLQDRELLALGPEAQPTTGPEKGEGGAPEAKREEGQRPSATLAVTPNQAQDLVLADQKGELRLALRPATDHRTSPLSNVTEWQLTGLAPPQQGAAGSAPAQPQPSANLDRPPRWWDEPPRWAEDLLRPPSRGEPTDKAAGRVEVIRGSQHEVVNVHD